MILRLLIRPRHLTVEGLAALRSLLAQHPGADHVEVAFYTERFRLPVLVACSEQLRRAAVAALGGVSCGILIGCEDAF